MAVMRENAESLFFVYAELCTPHSDTYVMLKEVKFRLKVSITFDDLAYRDT